MIGEQILSITRGVPHQLRILRFKGQRACISSNSGSGSLQAGLYTQGAGFYGALGLGGLDDAPEFSIIQELSSSAPPDAHDSPSGSSSRIRIARVSAGWGHSAALTTDGRVLVFGRPFDFKNLMRINGINGVVGGWAARAISRLSSRLADEKESGLYTSPRLLGSLTHCVDVRASAGLTVARTAAAHENAAIAQSQPQSAPGAGERESIAAGSGGSTGQIYAWGINRWGQCGTGMMGEHVLDPQCVQGLPGEAIAMDTGLQEKAITKKRTKQSGKTSHRDSNAASHQLQRRQLFAWGKGNRGQLGDGQADTSARPVPVPLPRLPVALSRSDAALSSSGSSSGSSNGSPPHHSSGKKTKKGALAFPLAVCAGFAHSAAICAQGFLYVWGKAMSDQRLPASALSIIEDRFEDQLTPRRIELPGGRKAVEVCSALFLVAVRCDDGTVWALGMGEHDRERVAVPIQVHAPYTDAEKEGTAEPRGLRFSTQLALQEQQQWQQPQQHNVLRKGHNRISVIPNSVYAITGEESDSASAYEIILHNGVASCQRFELDGPVDVLLKKTTQGQSQAQSRRQTRRQLADLSVGWKHALAVLQ